MTKTYHDAVIIITGAASGIGKALATELASSSTKLILIDLQQELLSELVSTLSKQNPNIEGIVCDVCDTDTFHYQIDQTAKKWGRIDYLFNNAGIGVIGEADLYELDMVRKLIAVNFNAVVLSTLFTLPIMKKQGFGHIINTGSLAGLIAFPWMSVYAGTKHGVVGFSKSLRAEASQYGVNVTALCPGLIATDIVDGGKYGKAYGYDRTLIREWVSGMFSISSTAFAPIALAKIARNPTLAIVPTRFRFLYILFSLIPDAASIVILKLLRKINHTKLQRLQDQANTNPTK